MGSFVARRCARTVALALVLAAASASAFAQAYPTKPVRIVVPYATGGGSDILARQIAAGLQAAWGQGVVVENRAGASGNIGTVEVVRAPADGYTLVLQNSTMVTNLAVSGKLPFDIENDLTPILLLGVTPIALAAHPEAKVADVQQLVAAAKDRSLSYGSCGSGTPQHFAMELLKQKTGVAAQHAGYKGCSPAVTDVLGNHVPLAIVSANLVAPHAKSGKLRVVGVTSARRYSLLPDTPTFEEQGIKPFDFSIWYALMGPAKLPAAVVNKIAADVDKVLADPGVQANLTGAGVERLQGSAQDLAKLIKDEATRYVELARSANIKSE